MGGIVALPKRRIGDGSALNQPAAPCWFPRARDGQQLKPVLRCNCGALVGLGNHAVGADGMVTASFLHNECGWHVWIQLEGWTGRAFPRGED